MAEPQTAETDAVDFIEAEGTSAPSERRSIVLDLPVEIVVSVGAARLTVFQLMNLQRDEIVALDAKIADPVDIRVGERLLARGELVDLDGENGGIGVRVTELVDAAGVR